MKKIHYILSLLFVAILSASCTQDMDVASNQGYLSLRVNSLTSTLDPNNTRAAAPDDYDAKKLRVEIRDHNDNLVKSTDDYANDAEFQEKLVLEAGSYTVVAHSANWDGSESGFDTPFYYGSAKVQVLPQTLVTARVTCTLNNVKITVNFDQTFKEGFKSAVATVSSSDEAFNPLEFIMNFTNKSGYIPVVDSFEVKLDVVNKSNVDNTMTIPFRDVKARDHYILNFRVAETGNLGDGTGPGINVEVDESTNTYTYTFEVPKKSAITLVTRAANAWSTFAMLNASVTAKTEAFDATGLTIQWREVGETEWTVIENDDLSIDEDDNVSATLKGLAPRKAYEYRLCYVSGDDELVCDAVQFTTEDQIALYNGGFENWWMDGKVAYATEQGTKFWDSSNKGSASFGGSNTTQTTTVVHGGSSAAKLESKYIVIKFAAASLYTGSFGKLIGTSGAVLNWGVPFTARPTALKGYMQYAPVNINRVGSDLPSSAPAKGSPDLCGMYCALLSESLVVDNTDMSTFPDWQNDDRVIAYGELPASQNVDSKGEWKEVNIPFVYSDITKKPTHLLIVFSASKYGDYFHGGEGSTLYLDDFSLEYGDNPSVR